MGGRPPLPEGPWLVVGLARSGVAAALALRALGHEVVACDGGDPERPALVEAAASLRAAGIEVRIGPRSSDGVVSRVRAVVKSPGVPREAPVIAAALEAGRPVLGELELGWRLVANRFVAVTGTNGKTTTTEWIGHVLRVAGWPVAVAGNVGTALSSLGLGAGLDPSVTVVCEASSFQLEDTVAFAPEVAVLLNLSPDHLDRHGTFDAYVAAKLRIFANQGNDDVAVAPLGLGIEDLGGCARRVCVGAGPGAELSARAGQLWWDETPLISEAEISLPGDHNRANAMAAAAACLALGVSADAVAEGLRTFAGVAHRLQTVAVRDGVTFVNDSKATNVDAAVVALRSYDGGVHVILGGRGKAQDFSPLAAVIAERAAAVYLIGEAAEEIGIALAGGSGVPGVPIVRAGDLSTAVVRAAAAARPGETVLLSPACASYDQFTDFEARGEAFAAIVAGLDS